MAEGVPIIQRWETPRDKVMMASDLGWGMSMTMIVHPSTYLTILYGRTPLWTRHMAGVREGERDRRKHA
jgi:hypothetical protein